VSLTFPFLVLGKRRGGALQRIESHHAPGHVLTFSSVRRASDYMVSQGATNWEFTLIVRPGVKIFLEEIRNDGVSGIYHNLDAEGYGEAFAIETLMEMFGT
jgi:hypothetical protein